MNFASFGTFSSTLATATQERRVPFFAPLYCGNVQFGSNCYIQYFAAFTLWPPLLTSAQSVLPTTALHPQQPPVSPRKMPIGPVIFWKAEMIQIGGFPDGSARLKISAIRSTHKALSLSRALEESWGTAEP